MKHFLILLVTLSTGFVFAEDKENPECQKKLTHTHNATGALPLKQVSKELLARMSLGLQTKYEKSEALAGVVVEMLVDINQDTEAGFFIELANNEEHFKMWGMKMTQTLPLFDKKAVIFRGSFEKEENLTHIISQANRTWLLSPKEDENIDASSKLSYKARKAVSPSTSQDSYQYLVLVEQNGSAPTVAKQIAELLMMYGMGFEAMALEKEVKPEDIAIPLEIKESIYKGLAINIASLKNVRSVDILN